ncbi:MAG TPA: Asp-tRNA(Asn)/Glu-tRNA(Gln) amidotransferase GatCAB subunit B, partial [Opitutaceae bacterium]|nr:Asp-tRNA(Asn)/Glu-tRNA(Gln) amidotransferase GatCAB subunit B [Opitutaceae bacterium]
ANISIRKVGETRLGTKVELKNLNSISFVRAGIAHEIKRQIAVVEKGGTISQETRDYDGLTGTSQSLRSKEMAHDYRYFPDPDLMPVKVDEDWKARLRATCPELPFEKQRRFYEAYQLPYTITSVLVPDRELSDYFEKAAQLAGPGKAQAVGNWIVNDVLRELGVAKVSLSEFKVTPSHIADLVQRIEAGTLLNHAAKEVLLEIATTGDSVQAIVERKGLKAETNQDELEQWCRDAIAGNAKSLADFKAGKDSAINAFKGPVMKASKGKANPKLVDETLRRLLAAG